jgi:hypothetical protein
LSPFLAVAGVVTLVVTGGIMYKFLTDDDWNLGMDW